MTRARVGVTTSLDVAERRSVHLVLELAAVDFVPIVTERQGVYETAQVELKNIIAVRMVRNRKGGEGNKGINSTAAGIGKGDKGM